MLKSLANCVSSLVFLNLWGKGKGGVYKGGLSGKVILPETNSSNFCSPSLLFTSTPFFSVSTSIFSSLSVFPFSFLGWSSLEFFFDSSSSFPLLKVTAMHCFRLVHYYLEMILGDFLSRIEPIYPFEFLDFL